jgi:hypothetical protein
MPTTNVPTSEGETVEAHGSALFVIKLPEAPNGIPASTMTCTIDARWGPGEIVSNGPLIPILDAEHLRKPEDRSPYNNAAGFLPRDDGSWKSISIEPTWLRSLTPIVDGDSGNRTTLTNIFEVIGLINGTNHIPNIDFIYDFASNAIATMVTDGLSRLGIRYQVGNKAIDACYIDPQQYPGFFSGDQDKPSYTYPGPEGVSQANRTRLTWYITIPGLSYKADSSGSILSLSLLFTYVLMALIHTSFVAWKRYYFGTWDGPMDWIVLSKNSPPATTLDNTCSGIECLKTWSQRVRIRKVTDRQKKRNPELVGEELHFLVGPVSNEDTDYEEIEANTCYGKIEKN